jgi:hypothetical protein
MLAHIGLPFVRPARLEIEAERVAIERDALLHVARGEQHGDGKVLLLIAHESSLETRMGSRSLAVGKRPAYGSFFEAISGQIRAAASRALAMQSPTETPAR